ncbi:MAG TPA: hypothetical protein VFO99_00655 [Pyrinomonadaceae bacterium]|nr:hypothetical protein [Pyrinomonadaceae bacterium]
MKISLAIVMTIFVFAGCSRNTDGEHTTATTVVPPPPRQVLRAEFRDAPPPPVNRDVLQAKKYDREKPIMLFDMKDGATYREREPVVIEFALVNAQLKGDGGEYRVRYMVDDDDMQWIDRMGQVWLWGWLPGKHTVRLELIGQDGWPYRNGDLNVETREITIEK